MCGEDAAESWGSWRNNMQVYNIRYGHVAVCVSFCDYMNLCIVCFTCIYKRTHIIIA